MIHTTPSKYAGTKVRLKIIDETTRKHPEVDIGDWWDRIAMASWKDCLERPAVDNYFKRVKEGDGKIPADDEVLYCTHKSIGCLVHITEVVGEPDAPEVKIERLEFRNLPNEGKIENGAAFIQFFLNRATKLQSIPDLPTTRSLGQQVMNQTLNHLTNIIISDAGADENDVIAISAAAAIFKEVIKGADDWYGVYDSLILNMNRECMALAGFLIHLRSVKKNPDEWDDGARQSLFEAIKSQAATLATTIGFTQIMAENPKDFHWTTAEDKKASIHLLELRPHYAAQLATRVRELISEALVESVSRAVAAS